LDINETKIPVIENGQKHGELDNNKIILKILMALNELILKERR
jgi:hypothetical protein